MDILNSLPGALLPWYSENARDLPWRKASSDPYPVWLSEIMLQQTRVEAVRGYYTRFLTALPTIRDLARVDEDQLMKLWEGLGYYNRARNLKRAAQMIEAVYGGKFPETHEEILTLPGIGPYTAGAIASICFSLPYPAVDGNVLRVYARLMEMEGAIDLPAVKKAVTDALTAILPPGESGAFNQAIMELGAMVCVPNGAPQCGVCPLAHLCRARASGTQLKYPVRLEKRARRPEEVTVFILSCDVALAVIKRGDTGLLRGLWALPHVSGLLDEAGALEQARAWGVDPLELTKSSERKHIFTHVEWEMRGFYLRCRVQSPRFTWVSADERSERVALPTAFRQFLGD
ncbi:MAG: A/G-specific adenine glycosylase [Oscillospiraceae bacterium]|nr:A/G-specific adenine glycosylase [Oscillospiraceae bacterium]